MSESETEKKLITIRATIARIRVFLQQEGGDIELDSFDEETGVVKVRLRGACAGCFLAGDEITMGVESILRQEIPSITSVEIVSEDGAPISFDPRTGFSTINGIPVIDPLADDDEDEEDPLSPRAQLVRAQRILTKTDEVDRALNENDAKEKDKKGDKD